MRPHIRYSRGFTLVEMVVAITVSAIVIVFLTMFMSAPVEAYFAQSRRASLVDASERISREIRRDIADALPRSVRQRSNGTFRVFDLIAIERTRAGDIARYRAGPPNDAQHLAINQVDADGFAILGTYLPPASPPTQLPGQRRLVVGLATSDPYVGVRVMSAPMSVWLQSLGQDEELMTFSAPVNFQSASRVGRVFVTAAIPTVAYLCDLTAQTITRYEGFPVESITLHDSAAELNAKSTSSNLIAANVTACTFRPTNPRDVPGAPGTVIRGMLSYQVALTLAGETTRVFDQVPLELGP